MYMHIRMSVLSICLFVGLSVLIFLLVCGYACLWHVRVWMGMRACVHMCVVCIYVMSCFAPHRASVSVSHVRGHSTCTCVMCAHGCEGLFVFVSALVFMSASVSVSVCLRVSHFVNLRVYAFVSPCLFF